MGFVICSVGSQIEPIDNKASVEAFHRSWLYSKQPAKPWYRFLSYCAITANPHWRILGQTKRTKQARQIRDSNILSDDLDLLDCCELVLLCHCITAGPAGAGNHHGPFGRHSIICLESTVPVQLDRVKGVWLGPRPQSQDLVAWAVIYSVVFLVVAGGL